MNIIVSLFAAMGFVSIVLAIDFGLAATFDWAWTKVRRRSHGG